jgi:MoaA/NifB/PqqE/SkfB family radical SAM enzyme
MGKIVIELTNRCNLSCQHCFSRRHGGRDDLPLSVIKRILAEAKTHDFDHLSFTGGEPTIHPDFAEMLRLTHQAGYRFGFNSNGWNFRKIYPYLLPFRESLSTITFSLDGATEETHDRLRG